ncbi:MAG: response regulator, partial [Arcobacteraceae bacterium]
VKLMGGEIFVQSEKGTGTTFSFNIVLKYRENDYSFLSQNLKNKNILVIEYEDKVKNSLNEMIKMIGLNVQYAFDRKSASKLLQSSIYDYIVLDWKMPEKEATSILYEMKVYCKEYAKRSFILAQSWEQEKIHTILKQHEIAIKNIILKPFSTSTFLDALVNDTQLELIESKNKIEKFKGTVLLVEDNKINQLVAEQNFKKFGLEVICALNGEIAVQKAKENNFDIIFMDLHMPVMDGFDATILIRKFNKDVPIVALSAAVMPEDISKTKEVGMQDHLSKPINIKALRNVLRKYLISEIEIVEKKQKIDNTKDIKGINLKELFERFNQEKDLAYSSLNHFAKDKKNILTQIENISDDSKEFHDLIHTLKGLSGNLAFTDVFKYSSYIHDSDNKDKIRQVIPLLKKSLEVVLDSIASLEDKKPISNDENEAYLKSDFINNLVQISEDIGRGSFLVKSKIMVLVKQVEYFVDKLTAEVLEDKLLKLDYETAKKILDTIKRDQL